MESCSATVRLGLGVVESASAGDHVRFTPVIDDRATALCPREGGVVG